MSHFIYYFRSSGSDVDGDGERQRFVNEFHLYEDKLFKSDEREHLASHRSNDTLGNLYFRLVEWLCMRMVPCMFRFHERQKIVNRKDNKAPTMARVPLSAVHSLYKMEEFYVPVYDAVSYDVDMLCIACKMLPVYKPCSRLAKKNCCQRFRSRFFSVLLNMS